MLDGETLALPVPGMGSLCTAGCGGGGALVDDFAGDLTVSRRPDSRGEQSVTVRVRRRHTTLIR